MAVSGTQVLQAYESMLESREKKAERSSDLLLTLALTKQKQAFDIDMLKMQEEATIRRDKVKLDGDILMNQLDSTNEEIDFTKKAIQKTELEFSKMTGDVSLLTDLYKTYEAPALINSTGENQLQVLSSQLSNKEHMKDFYENRLDKGLKSLMRLDTDVRKFNEYALTKDWTGESKYLDPHEWEAFFAYAMDEVNEMDIAFEGAGLKEGYDQYLKTGDIPKSSRTVLRDDMRVLDDQSDLAMANMLVLITPGTDEYSKYIDSDGKIKLDKWKEKFGDDVKVNDVAAIMKALQVVGTGKESNWKAFMQYINAETTGGARRVLEGSKYNNVMKLLDDNYAKYDVLERELREEPISKSGRRVSYADAIANLDPDDVKAGFNLFNSITGSDYLNNHDTKELFAQIEEHYKEDLGSKFALHMGYDKTGVSTTTENAVSRLKGVVGTKKDVFNEGLLVKKDGDKWHEGNIRVDENGDPIMLSGEDLYNILDEYTIKSLDQISEFHKVTGSTGSWDRRFFTGGKEGGYNQGVNMAKDYNPEWGFLGLGSSLEGESPYYEAFYESMEDSYSKHSKASTGTGKYFSWLPRFGVEGSIPQDILDTYGEDAYNLAMEVADAAGQKAQIEQFNKVLSDPASLAYPEVIRILDYMKNNEEMEPVNDEDVLEKGIRLLPTAGQIEKYTGPQDPSVVGRNIFGGQTTFSESLGGASEQALLDVAELAGGAYGLAEAGYEEVSEQLDEYPDLKDALSMPAGDFISQLAENLDFGTEPRPEFKMTTPENWLTKTLVSLDIMDRPTDWGPSDEGSEIMDDASMAIRRLLEHGVPGYKSMTQADKDFYMSEMHKKISEKPNKEKLKFLNNASNNIPEFKEFLIMQAKADPSLSRYLKKHGIDPDKLDKYTEYRLFLKLKPLGINLEGRQERSTSGRRKRHKEREKERNK